MITVRGRQGNDADHRFAEPPWDEQTPRWQEIDQGLPADHLARQIDRAVGDRVALDGTLIAALASRHRLVNQETLTDRTEALKQAIAGGERQTHQF